MYETAKAEPLTALPLLFPVMTLGMAEIFFEFRGRYEITVTFFTISLLPLMPERYFCVTVIV